MTEKKIFVTDIFGMDVFNDEKMIERLPKKAYLALKKTIEKGEDLDLWVADAIANERLGN